MLCGAGLIRKHATTTKIQPKMPAKTNVSKYTWHENLHTHKHTSLNPFVLRCPINHSAQAVLFVGCWSAFSERDAGVCGVFFVSRDHGILLFVCGLNKAAVVQCMGWAVQSAKPSAGRDYVYVTLKLFSYANLQKIIAAWRTVGENFWKIPSILWSEKIQKVWPTDATRSFCVNVVFFLAEDLKSLSKFVELGTICLVLIYCKLLQGLTYFWARF